MSLFNRDIKVRIPHRLPHGQALGRVKGLLKQLVTDHAGDITNVDEQWEGDTCAFSLDIRGHSVSGALVVDTGEVVVSGQVPVLALPFKARIAQTIEREGQKRLA